MNLDHNYLALRVITEYLEMPFELAVKFFRFQSDDYFTLPAGQDVRIEPNHFRASSVFYLGNGEEGISFIKNLEGYVDEVRGLCQISGIIIFR